MKTERTTEMRLTQNRKTVQALFLHGSVEPFGVGIGAGITICSATGAYWTRFAVNG
jgi:hypothetical protein